MLDQLKTLKRIKLLTPTATFRKNIATARQANNQHNLKHLIHERLVFSFLAFRSRKGKAVSLREICRETGLHPTTAKTAVRNLAALVHKRGGKWLATEPPQELFRHRTPTGPVEHWADKLAYTTLYLPRKGAKILCQGKSRRFGLNHSAVFSFIISRARQRGNVIRHFTYAGQAAMLGLDVKTVKSAVDDLVNVGLIHREDLGRSSDITLLPLTREHLMLLQPTSKRKEIRPSKTPVPPTPVAYILKGDPFDEYRLLCERRMIQQHAEEAILKARRMGIGFDGFEDRLERAWKCHEDNVAAGKVTKGNFGKYFSVWLGSELEKLKKQEKQEEDAERLRELRKTPEGQAAEAERQKAIAADPTHYLHSVSRESITDRVRFSDNALTNLREMDMIRSQLHRSITNFLAPKHLPTQQEVDESGNMHQRLLARALKKLNHYYLTPIRATGDEFRAAIDEAIRVTYPTMTPIWATAEKKTEVAHA